MVWSEVICVLEASRQHQMAVAEIEEQDSMNECPRCHNDSMRVWSEMINDLIYFKGFKCSVCDYKEEYKKGMERILEIKG